MSYLPRNPTELLQRPWRPGHKVRAGTALWRRRWAMALVLFLLCLLIGAYVYITESQRVRAMAEGYLSNVLGADVTVRRATLTVFEGLRLEQVRVSFDEPERSPTPMFTADALVVKYDIRAMLTGRLVAKQIIAKRPHVVLTEKLEEIVARYGERFRGRRDKPGAERHPQGLSRRLNLPEILLRDAHIEYAEFRDGELRPTGRLLAEGWFSPSNNGDRYSFEFQTRGGGDEAMGPYVSGELLPRQGKVTARLMNFAYDQNIQSMLPAIVREWGQQHELSGGVDVEELSYSWAKDAPEAFRVRTSLKDVTLSVHPEELLSASETRRLTQCRRGLSLLQSMFRATGHVRTPVDQIIPLFGSSVPIRLESMSGHFTFTPSGIDVTGVIAQVENNALHIDGRIDGYPRVSQQQPPMRVRIASGEKLLTVPPNLKYINSMPRAVRDFYDHLRPQGTCALDVEIIRSSEGGRINAVGGVKVIDGQFVFLRFPYPVRKATGAVTFVSATEHERERVELDLTGVGIEGGPNADAGLRISGKIGPLGANAGVEITVSGANVRSEPALRTSFPPEVQQALRMFDPDRGETYPIFEGSFDCAVKRPVGPRTKWDIYTVVRIDKATGALHEFPYMLRDLAMELRIGDTSVEIINANMKHGGGGVRVDGVVSWNKTRSTERRQTKTDLRLVAMDLPIDDQLLTALPPDRRELIQKLGLGGNISVDGTIKSDSAAGGKIDYELGLKLSKGTLWPAGGMFVLNDASGSMTLWPHRIAIHELIARRGDGRVSLKGDCELTADGRPRLDLSVSAENLLLDSPLYAMLPEDAKRAWDEVRPSGTVDGDLRYISNKPDETFTTTIRPRALSANLQSMPYALTHLGGAVTITSSQTTLQNVTARHGDARFTINGTGEGGPAGASKWDLSLTGDDVPLDEQLRAALPSAAAELMTSINLRGIADMQFDRILYETKGLPLASTTAPGALTATASPAPARPADVTLLGRLLPKDVAMDLGVPLTGVQGTIAFDAGFPAGRIAGVTGSLDLNELKIAGRTITGMRASIEKPAQQAQLRLSDIGAQLAGGTVAGDVSLTFPDEGDGTYNLDLILQNADAHELVQPSGTDRIQGQLSASLALEGKWEDPSARRGRGDVLVSGKEMYQMPMILGLLQVTNLSLPINSPFNEGAARFVVDASTVYFESLQFKSDLMLMDGDGHIDFGTGQVHMTFRTDNPKALQVPFISDLWRGAQQELFKIQVRGTVTKPKVSGEMMGTFTTTIDEVLKGGD